MSYPDYAGAIVYALTRLDNELSTDFLYHNIEHTRDDVMVSAMRLARMGGVSLPDKRLLEVAAAFHDMGFLVKRFGHEEESCQIVRSVLPAFSFSGTDINRICGMIRATCIPQSPTNFLESILADADLDILGRRADFWRRNQDLRDEMAHFDGPMTDAQWYGSQYEFLQKHTYFTQAARELRQADKEHYIWEMGERYRQAKGTRSLPTLAKPLKYQPNEVV